jgi:hypothetical protein
LWLVLQKVDKVVCDTLLGSSGLIYNERNIDGTNINQRQCGQPSIPLKIGPNAAGTKQLTADSWKENGFLGVSVCNNGRVFRGKGIVPLFDSIQRKASIVKEQNDFATG